jgi:hypothetical protein
MRTPVFRGLLVMVIWSQASQAQTELRGRLLSGAGEPIPAATITVGGIGYSVKSDSTGRFAIAGARGSTLKLFFSATGYRRDSAAVVLGGSALSREFTLVDANAPLSEANPSAAMLHGRVVEESGAALSYANVQVNYSERIVADDSGRFAFPYESGSRTLLVRRIGFEPYELRLTSKPDTALRIVLQPVATQLKEVTVVASNAAFRSLDIHGFYRRMREYERGGNRGYFITPEDIERRKATHPTQMADGFPTIRVYKSGQGPMWDRILGRGNCEMTVYLDNIPIAGKPRGANDFVNQLASISSVAAMEIYPTSLSVPPQYQGACGVVLIWTK